jgi:hypothetical protein
MKTASFHVRATLAQSVAWKRAAEAYGHASVGTWIPEALDRYLDALKRAGKPLPLAWSKGRFTVNLESGETVTLPGFVSPPFGAFRGTAEGPGYRSCKRYTLVFTPQARAIATLRTYRQAQALASELSRVWVRWGGNEPAEDPGPVLERHRRESL